MKNLAILVFFVFFQLFFSQNQKVDTLKLDQFKRVTLDKIVDETSGLTFFKEKLYTFNDSGGKPEIYQIKPRKGKVKETYKISAKNIDWEAITSDGENFYIGDFGNNLGMRKDLKIYKINFHKKEKIQHATSINFNFPEQISFEKNIVNHDFDCEAMIFIDGKINIFTKEWKSRNVTRYQINPNLENQSAQKKETFFTDYVVTDATFYDGKLYFVGYTKQAQVYLSIFEEDKNGFFFSKPIKKYFLGLSFSVGQIEGITANSEGLFISGERFKTKVSDFPQSLYFVPFQNLR